MSIQMDSSSVNISREDLAVVADATVIRFPVRGPESRRVARMREMLASASDLSRALSDHTHHSLVDCQGSHGTWDLARDVDVLFRALDAYAASVREVAAEYRSVVRGPTRVPVEDPASSLRAGADAGAA